MKRLINGALGILFPPFCVHCQRLLHFTCTDALCPECQRLWENEKHSVCKSCYKGVEDCECVPSRASKRIKRCYHLTEYDSEEESVTRSILLCCKDHDYAFVNELVSSELEQLLRSRMKSFKNTVITYVPRKNEKVINIGVDQSMTTAMELSKKLEIEFVKAIIRVGGKEQKALDSLERMKNAAMAFAASSSAIPAVNGRTVIIYDDVITTGSSVSACADLLKTMGARTVIVLSLARVYPKIKETDTSWLKE